MPFPTRLYKLDACFSAGGAAQAEGFARLEFIAIYRYP
jgi:hypothetical protein